MSDRYLLTLLSGPHFSILLSSYIPPSLFHSALCPFSVASLSFFFYIVLQCTSIAEYNDKKNKRIKVSALLDHVTINCYLQIRLSGQCFSPLLSFVSSFFLSISLFPLSTRFSSLLLLFNSQCTNTSKKIYQSIFWITKLYKSYQNLSELFLNPSSIFYFYLSRFKEKILQLKFICQFRLFMAKIDEFLRVQKQFQNSELFPL